MNTKNLPKFTCNECGCHELIVTHAWNIQAGSDSERWQEWGPLKDDHHWQYEFKEKIEEDADDEVLRGDFGEFEIDNSTSEPEEYETFKAESNSENDEFFVNCENCDREIEFGWSQSNRHGLIFPVEFLDFRPTENWPDPKYLDSWRKKNWLQAGYIQQGLLPTSSKLDR
jgi:hypothetical protein